MDHDSKCGRVPDKSGACILEIERFAVHDGPGIRTVVFFKGCPLHCPWCSNPESQNPLPELLYCASKCTGCGNCAACCPRKAVRMEEGPRQSGPVFNGPVFDRGICAACGSCAASCPGEALRIAGKCMETEEILAIALRDRDYYETSGGGVTVSGGEPFSRSPALLQLLKQCKEQGLRTAVETTGQIAPEDLKAAEPCIDLFLLDIKHAAAETLASVTGADAELIRKNTAWLGEHCPGKVRGRVPVIPGFNHDKKSMEDIFALALSAKIGALELLPYHTLGKDKYRQLGLCCSWPAEKMLDTEDLEAHAQAGRNMGLAVEIL